jgi:hypothetical protein
MLGLAGRRRRRPIPAARYPVLATAMIESHPRWPMRGKLRMPRAFLRLGRPCLCHPLTRTCAVTGRFDRDYKAYPLPLDKTVREGEKASPRRNSRVIMAAISGRSWQACKEADRAETHKIRPCRQFRRAGAGRRRGMSFWPKCCLPVYAIRSVPTPAGSRQALRPRSKKSWRLPVEK